MMVQLRRWPNDTTLSGQSYIACCDCGLAHLHTYQILLTSDKEWYLINRAYRINEAKGQKDEHS